MKTAGVADELEQPVGARGRYLTSGHASTSSSEVTLFGAGVAGLRDNRGLFALP